MDAPWDYSGDVLKRDWAQFNNTAVNGPGESESENKRQCTGNAAQETSPPGLYQVTPSLIPTSQFDEAEAIRAPRDIWACFPHEQPMNNPESMDTFDVRLDLAKSVTGQDLVEQSSRFCLEAVGVPELGQSLRTPGSECNYSDAQDEVVSMSQGNSGNDAPSPQSLPDKPYDVCFGMVTTKASCHSLSGETGEFVAVNVQIIGDVLKLYSFKSNKNVGILTSLVFRKLSREFSVSILARCERPKGDTGKRQSLGHKETLMQIVIYGFRQDMDEVGSILADNGLFLQHPAQSDTSVPYENPQFLLAPGAEMPQPEDLAAEPVTTSATLEERLDRGLAAEVFGAFNAVDGPTTFAPVEPSWRLRTKLKEHQVKALAMMTEKECGAIEGADFPSLWEVLSNFDGNLRYRHAVTGIANNTRPLPPAGGILADEMGLGKTLSVLALIAWYLDGLSIEAPEPRATLIVATPSTIPVWIQQISRHFLPGQIRTAVYHGSNRHKQSSVLSKSEIVITTYDTLRHEWSNGSANTILFSDSNAWARVVLDEAHHIRNRSSKTFQAVCEIRARYRWCLTGTPIQNRLDDYGALLSFIGVPPFTGKSGKASFEEWVSAPIHSHDRRSQGLQRLRKLVAATCLRRTKEHVQDQLTLPSRNEKEHYIELDPVERRLYDFFKTRASSLLVGNSSQRTDVDKARWQTILSLINILRMACSHGECLLPAAALELWNSQNASTVDLQLDEMDIDSEGYENTPVNHTLDMRLTQTLPTEMVDAYYRPSSKVKALLTNLQDEQRTNGSPSEKAPVKSVIFTFWTKMLDLLEVALRANNFVFQRIDGQTPLENRSTALKKLREDSSCTVLLASIGSIAEGVDLTAASCVHLVEPQWNPMVEKQAVDRVHRIGQVRDVAITRYIVEDSIEKYVREIQRTKLDLVQQSFADDRTTDKSALRANRFQEIVGMLA